MHMLEDSLFESDGRKKPRNPVTVVVSATAHVVTVGLLVLIPLLQTQALTIPSVNTSMFLPRIEKLPEIPVFSAQPKVANHSPGESAVLTAPERIPPQIASVDEPPVATIPFSMPGGERNGVGFIRNLSNTPPIEAPTSVPQPP